LAFGLLAVKPVTTRRPLLRIAAILAVVVASFLGQRQISGMDRIFFQPSLQGLKGLALYLMGGYEGAAKAYRAHWRARVLDGRTTGDRGTDLILAGDLDAAERFARERLGRRPNDVTALLLLAELALESGASAEASRLAIRALAAEPDAIDAQVMLSLAQARAGASGEAIDTINRALRTGSIGERLATFYQFLETIGTLRARPASERPRCLLAHYHRYFRVFDWSQARAAARYAREAITAGDRPADAYLTLGILDEKAGRFDDALASFHSAIEADPRHAEAYRWAAIVYGKRGDLVNEYRMITVAFAQSGDLFYTDHLYRVLIDKVGDPARATALLEPVVARAPRDARLRARVGHAWALQGNEARALEHYRYAIALAPRDPEIHYGMGWALRRLGKSEEAIAALRRAVALAPYWYQPRTQLLHVYHHDRRYAEAIAEAEATLRLGEPSVYVHAILCNLYHSVVDLERAESCVQALLARDPGNAVAVALLPKIRHEASLR
jgi:tetratricopeptide (TPR) repeat protein